MRSTMPYKKIPAMSILRGDSNVWASIKSEWLKLGIKSEIGRNTTCNPETESKYMKGVSKTQNSIFDPVLCELFYDLYCPLNGKILDPFAGGSVRGIVASHKGMNYTGIELREKQVEANKEQMHLAKSTKPIWICGDSNTKVLELDNNFDLLFSCPPYGDLEVYSDDKNDISNMSYTDFKEVYTSIINKSVSRLKDTAFAIFVVGNYRGKNGYYYNLVGDTIEAFVSSGMGLYNDIIFVSPYGTAPIRAPRSIMASRKFTKVHQNILVFAKGHVRTAIHELNEQKQIGEFNEYHKKFDGILDIG